MRLHKFIALSGIASRRKAENLITAGVITVNGKVVNEQGFIVSDNDVVCYNDSRLEINKHIYLMLNKPIGYITTVSEQFGRKNVMDLVKSVPQRIYPVGRLDCNTSGLLIMTNDGDLAYNLTKPGMCEKTYIANVIGKPSVKTLKRFRNGIMLDGKLTMPAKIEIVSANNKCSTVQIVLSEGRNRQIRKMMELLNHPVVELKRIAIGNLQLGKLKPGHHMQLTQTELNLLFRERI